MDDGLCEVYQGALDRDGYGQKWVNGKNTRAHRTAWIEFYGEIPDGMMVCHHCDNPSCINIDHLFLGTNADNQKDSVKKNRHWEVKKTHCPKGHPYDNENTYRHPRGDRQCRKCLSKAQLPPGG